MSNFNNNNNNNNASHLGNIAPKNVKQTHRLSHSTSAKRMTILRHVAEAFPPARQGTILNRIFFVLVSELSFSSLIVIFNLCIVLVEAHCKEQTLETILYAIFCFFIFLFSFHFFFTLIDVYYVLFHPFGQVRVINGISLT